MTHARQALGLEGETRACRALEARGYRVLQRRYRTRYGELDIVARHDQTVVFVEVKARSGRAFGDPAAAVTTEKQRRLVAMATDYLTRHGLARAAVRFDVVSVTVNPGEAPAVTIYPDAFRPGW
ncbi:MAG: YraN family protein [Acidobacteriota bacterium]